MPLPAGSGLILEIDSASLMIWPGGVFTADSPDIEIPVPAGYDSEPDIGFSSADGSISVDSCTDTANVIEASPNKTKRNGMNIVLFSFVTNF